MRKKIPLRPTREPAQARSRNTVQRILSAALEVLKSNGIEGFTSNHVAAAAGLSVASVYQFFPNKQAIIYRLYQDWLQEVTDRLTREVACGREEPSWQRFAERLSDVLAAAAFDRHAEYELLRAMWSHRELIDLDQRHSRSLGDLVAQSMRRYGSKWPDPELRELASFANELHSLVAERTMHGSDTEKRRLDEFARVAYLAMWRHALSSHTILDLQIEPAVSRKSPSATKNGTRRAGRKVPGASRRNT